jgi:hypothetical protein
MLIPSIFLTAHWKKYARESTPIALAFLLVKMTEPPCILSSSLQKDPRKRRRNTSAS